jgi:hypothetical protein
LHRIEERIDGLTPSARVDELTHLAEQHAEQEMPGRKATELKQQLATQVTVEGKRKTAVTVIHNAHSAAEERHESERNQQRGILYIAAGLFVAAVVTIVVQAIMPAGDRIIPLPSNGATMAGWASRQRLRVHLPHGDPDGPGRLSRAFRACPARPGCHSGSEPHR